METILLVGCIGMIVIVFLITGMAIIYDENTKWKQIAMGIMAILCGIWAGCMAGLAVLIRVL